MSDKAFSLSQLEPIDEVTWRIPMDDRYGMRVEGRIYADRELLQAASGDGSMLQVAKVACLPGIQGASLAMPDIHCGYGFCIGGVAATDPNAGGVVSPGGVGYDINCGVRLLRSRLDFSEVTPRIESLMEALFPRIPAGMGEGGPFRFEKSRMTKLLERGCHFLEAEGLATAADVEHTESGGCLEGADASALSVRAIQRGEKQCGTLGSGNHFLEIQYVDEIFDESVAAAMGLRENEICVMLHSGSRGLGYQVCDDALRAMRAAPAKYGIELPDRQLICAPLGSVEAEQYFAGMRAAANYAWANRQLLTMQVRDVFADFFGESAEQLELELVYDVAHNIAKIEHHTVDGVEKELCVHRKGAARAFPAGHPELPPAYREVGQPVLIPGDMGRESWVLVGQPGAMAKTFGTTCHGAGRLMSRTRAAAEAGERNMYDEMRQRGVVACCRSRRGLAEEQPDAYKEVSRVVHVVEQAGLASRVARLKPMGVLKG